MQYSLKASVMAFALAASFVSLATAASDGSPDGAKTGPLPMEQAMGVNWKNVPTKSLSAGGVDFAYRELGKQNGGTPVVFLVHLTAVLDNWDPRIMDGIAAKHHVIAFDNRGIGPSSDSPSNAMEQMADYSITFIKAMGFTQVDLLGFSLGGMIPRKSC